MVGDAMVTGKAQAEDGVSGKLLIYSEVSLFVYMFVSAGYIMFAS